MSSDSVGQLPLECDGFAQRATAETQAPGSLEAQTLDRTALKQGIIGLLAGFSLETTPREAERTASYADLVPTGTRVYIAHVPNSDYADAVRLAARLRDEGLEPVPHLAARTIPDAATLESLLRRFRDQAALRQVLLIGGDRSRPEGRLSSAMEVLETGLLEQYGVRRIGVAGYPEGNRVIGPSRLAQALAEKNTYAAGSDAKLQVVTQFGFNATAIRSWARRIKVEGNLLPIIIGLAGPANLRTLMRYAMNCGIGPSTRVLVKKASGLAKMITVSAPDELITALAQPLASRMDGEPEGCISNAGISGVHFFPFGGFERTANWLKAVCNGEFTLNSEASGFQLDADLP